MILIITGEEISASYDCQGDRLREGDFELRRPLCHVSAIARGRSFLEGTRTKEKQYLSPQVFISLKTCFSQPGVLDLLPVCQLRALAYVQADCLLSRSDA